MSLDPRLNEELQAKGYKLVHLVGEGVAGRIYLIEKNDKRYALKQQKAKNSTATQAEIERFHREALNLARLNHPGLPKIYEMGVMDDCGYIVMDFVDASSLRSRLKGRPLPEREVRHLAIQLAEALLCVHSSGLIHRDIKPENILFSKDEIAKLIDFSLAETDSELKNKKEIAGSFNYCSPEQSGTLTLPVDGRADLYSLGVVLFECLTGRLPFTATSTSEILRKHATEKPPGVRDLNPEVSEVLAGLVEKLLNKDPDDRPSSAVDVLKALSVNNVTEQKSRLIGREKELDLLRLKTEFLLHSEGQVALVKGLSGSGKSRLILDMASFARNQGVVYLHGKALAGIATPYYTLKSAIESWILELERVPEKKSVVISSLKTFLEDWAHQLRHLSPHFTKLTNSNLTENKEGAGGNETFFEQVLFELFTQLHSKVGPVLLVIDDVQWLDRESRLLFSKLAASTRKKPLFFAFTARSESDHTSEVSEFCSALNIQNQDIIDLDAAPWGLEATTDYVQMFLGQEHPSENCKYIAEKIFQVAKGNVFSTSQYLKIMLDKSILSPHWGDWTVRNVDFELLLQTEDVQELMRSRMAQLHSETASFLAAAALVGSKFSPEVVSWVLDKRTLSQTLEEATHAALIERSEADGGYKFVHDKVREAALELLQETQKPFYHESIANALRAKSGDLLEIARHSHLGLNNNNKNTVFTDCARAGIESLHRHANSSAYQFFQNALALSAEFQPNSVFFKYLGEACARVGQFEESKIYLSRALGMCQIPLERANIRTLHAFSHFHLNDVSEAYKEICRGFDELGCNVTHRTPLAYFYSFLQLIGALLVLAFKIPVVKNEKTRERFEALCNMYIHLGTIAFSDLKMITITQLTQRGAYLRLRLGGPRNLAIAASNVAAAVAVPKLHTLSKLLVSKAEALSREIGDSFLTSDVAAWKAFALSFRGAETEAEVAHRHLHLAHQRTVKADDYYHSQILLTYGLFSRGLAREAVETAQAALSILKDSNHNGGATRDYSIHMLEYICIPAYSQLGLYSEAAAFQKICIEHMTNNDKNPIANCAFAFANLLYENQQQSNNEVLERYIDLYKQQNMNLLLVPYHAKLFYVAQVQTRLLQFSRCEKNEKSKFEKLLKRSFFELKLVADTPVLESYLNLYKALYLFELKNFSEAEKLLRKAETQAETSDNRMVLFECARTKGRLQNLSGDPVRVQAQYDNARLIASKFGWNPLLAELDNEFGHLAASSGSTTMSLHNTTHAFGTTMNSSASVENANLVRYLDAFLKVGLASSEIMDFKKQTQNILGSLVEILHAERALLFLWDGHSLQFETGRTCEQTALDIAEHYSRSIVDAARVQGKPVLLASDGQSNVSQSESVVANELRSVLAAPLLMGGNFVGVIYLDSRIAKGIFQMADAQILQAVGQHFAISIQMARSAKLELEKKLLEKDLEAAEVVQSLFVPKLPNFENALVSLSGFSKSASKSGGDWWFYETLDNGNIRVILADVSGHGVGSAMVTAVLSGLFQTLRHLESTKFIEEVNKHFLTLCREKYLATLTVCEVSDGSITWWNAGAPLFMILRDGQSLSCTGPGTSPLGLDETLTIPAKQMDLIPGDRIVLFTDGCFDAALPNHGRLGMRMLRKMVTSVQRDVEPSAFLVELVESLIGTDTHAELEDDLTVVVIDFKKAKALPVAS